MRETQPMVESGLLVAEEKFGSTDKAMFVFPAQGPQWAGMAAELLDSSPLFDERLHDCAQALEPFVDWSLLNVLRGAEGAPGLERVDVVQPALLAVMVALAELWRAQGIEPAAVVGRSLGEIATTCVAGAPSLSDAAAISEGLLLVPANSGRGGK